MKIQSTLKYFLIASLVAFASCSDDDTTTPAISTPDPEPVAVTDEVEIYDAAKIHNNLTLAIVNGSDAAFLLDKTGQKLYEWAFDDRVGNDLEILPDGKLLGIFKDENAQIQFGGYGGKIKIINLDGTTDWEYFLSSEDFVLHHDVEMLPSGNILLLVWERIDEATQDAQGATPLHVGGRSGNTEVVRLLREAKTSKRMKT